MNLRLLVAASLCIACATSAFAQDDASAQDNTSQAPAAPADAAAPMASDSQPMADMQHPAMHRAMKHHASHRAHVAGDPAVVDHSADTLVVTPTDSKITIPPQQ